MPGFGRTSSSETLTAQSQWATRERSRSLPMVCHSGVAFRRPRTPRWCRHWLVLVCLAANAREGALGRKARQGADIPGARGGRAPARRGPSRTMSFGGHGFRSCGRWSQETVDFLWLLAEYRARSSPRLLRRSAQLLFYQRWIGLLACAVQGAYAASLLEEPLARAACVNGTPVQLSEMDRPF